MNPHELQRRLSIFEMGLYRILSTLTSLRRQSKVKSKTSGNNSSTVYDTHLTIHPGIPGHTTRASILLEVLNPGNSRRSGTQRDGSKLAREEVCSRDVKSVLFLRQPWPATTRVPCRAPSRPSSCAAPLK